MIDSKVFYNKLRVKALLDKYLEGFIEYALQLKQQYSLTDEHIKGVITMSATVINGNKLAELSKLWKRAVPAEAFVNVPDGEYVGDLKEMKLDQSKKSGRLQVTSTFEIADGDNAGKTTKKFDGVDDLVSMGYFKRYCEIIGLDLPEDLGLWQEALDEFVANNVDLYNITVKSSKGKDDKTYNNVYVNGISEYTKGTEGTEGTEEGAAEPEPEPEAEAEAEAEPEEEAEEEQQVEPPKKFVKTFAKPVVKVAAKPIATAPKKIVAKR